MDAVPFCGWARLTVKAQKQKDYLESPKTLGEHLKKRRKELGLLQLEAAARMGIGTDTYANWEKGQDPACSSPIPARCGVPRLRSDAGALHPRGALGSQAAALGSDVRPSG